MAVSAVTVDRADGLRETSRGTIAAADRPARNALCGPTNTANTASTGRSGPVGIASGSS